MKKVSRIIISVLLIVLMLVPSSVFVSAEDVTSTTPIKQTYGPYEYYNLKDGLYTKKTVEGPNADGTYDVTIDSYTSDVSYISEKVSSNAIDILVLLDNSGSMGSKDKEGTGANKARKAISEMVDKLVTQYGAGRKFKANLAVRTFAFQSYMRLDYTEIPTEAGTLKEFKNTIMNIKDATGADSHKVGATDTEKGFKNAKSDIEKRLKNTNNKQILVFISDGHPSTGVLNSSGWDDFIFGSAVPGQGVPLANGTLKYAEEIKKFADIYTIGISGSSSSVTIQDENTLSTIVTSGYATALKNSSEQRDVNVGVSINLRRETLFMNIISSGWKANGSVKAYTWGDADNSRVYNASGTGDYYNIYKWKKATNLYQNWALKNTSWQHIPSDYSLNINENNPKASYYFGVNNMDDLANVLSQSVLYSISTNYISQGSLLGDYSIIDTTSSYFDIVENSWHTYKVPYDSASGSYEADLNELQYGEGDRKWDETNKTELSLEINTTTRRDGTIGAIEVPANENNASVIDSFVVKDDLVSLTPTHSGNKLRVTYKIRPKDSFMGAYSVATHDYNNSGIFKETVDSSNNTVYQAVQKFASLNSSYKVENVTPEVAVSLVNSRLNVADDNVKIGMLYDINELASNYNIEYDGRYSGNTYSLKYNNGALRAYNSSNSLVTYKATSDGVEFYPTDFVTLKTGGNVLGTGCENVVTDGIYIQFNSSGISLTDGTYSKTSPVIGKKMYIAWKTIDGASTLDDIINRFNAYNAAGQTDESATANQGIVNNVYYRNGFARVQQLLGTDNVNVYVPMITVSDSVISSVSGVKWNVSSSSLESTLGSFNSQNYSADSTKYDDALNAIDNIQINYKADICKNSRGNKENRFVLLQPLSEDNTKVAVISDSTDATFINDVYKNNDKIVTTSAHMLKFADKDGNERSQNDNIAEGDKFKVVLTYDAMYNNILAKQGAPFKATVDEHYTTTGDCSICKAASTSFTPSFLGYDAQIHLVSNAITVKKQGCDENHLNESFVFSLIGIKENAEGTDKDMSTAKVLSNFTIQGNGTRTIPVDANEYQYFYVVEDTNAKENNGWTWDYSGVKLNGSDYKGWAGLQNDAFELNPGDNMTLTFKNEYNADNENLHYASAYCSNILSNGKDTTVTDSHSLTTNNTEG